MNGGCLHNHLVQQALLVLGQYTVLFTDCLHFNFAHATDVALLLFCTNIVASIMVSKEEFYR